MLYPHRLQAAWLEHLAPRDANAPSVISTFAGTGGSSLGYSMAGYIKRLSVEWDAHAVECYKLNFPGVPVFHGDVGILSVEQALELAQLQPGELDVFDGSPPCFPAGAKVLTINDIIPIEACSLGTLVLTHTGRFQKVINVMSRKYRGQLCVVTTKYRRRPVTCTPEHPFWARRRLAGRDKEYGPAEWIAAQHLRTSDVICEPHVSCAPNLQIRPVEVKQRINQEGQSGTEKAEYRLIQWEHPVDWSRLDIAWILGFFLAEGHTRGRDPQTDDRGPNRRETIFSVSREEAAAVASRLARAGFHAQYQNHGRGAARITVTDPNLRALCLTMGKYAEGKLIPPAFLAAPVKWQRAFLEGYFDGDGCIKNSKRVNSSLRKATTVSLAVAEGIAKMVATVHQVVASIDVLYEAGESEIEGRKVTVQETYSVGYTLDRGSQRTRPGWVDEAGAWLPVRSVSFIDTDGIDVHNLEVEGDNSYTADGFAVHNCQGFSTTGKRDFGDGRNQLFEHYARLLEGLRPKAFVMENVSGMVKGVMKLMFAEIFGRLEGCGYRVKARILNAKHFGVPQARERVIFIGMRKDLRIDPMHPAADFLIPVSASEACEGCPPPPADLPPMTAHYRRMWHLISPGKNGSSIVKNKNWNFLKLHPSKPAPTICKSVMLTGFGAMAHWAEPRCMSIAELKRLGSFPDDFQLVGEFENQWARIGNAVPPLLMRAVARQVRQTIASAGMTKEKTA